MLIPTSGEPSFASGTHIIKGDESDVFVRVCHEMALLIRPGGVYRVVCVPASEIVSREETAS